MTHAAVSTARLVANTNTAQMAATASQGTALSLNRFHIVSPVEG